MTSDTDDLNAQLLEAAWCFHSETAALLIEKGADNKGRAR